MSGLGRGGRGALLLKALKNPAKPPGQPSSSHNANGGPGATQGGQLHNGTPGGASANGKSHVVNGSGDEAVRTEQVQPQPEEIHFKKLSLEEKHPKKEDSQKQSHSSKQNHSSKESHSSEESRSSKESSSSEESHMSKNGTKSIASRTSRSERYEIKESQFTQRQEKGTHGDKVNVYANTIPIKSLSGGAYLYHVSFTPDIENRSARYGMLNEHKDIIGSRKAFDGATLYLPRRLKENVTKLTSKRQSDGQEVELTIQFVKSLAPTDNQCIHIYNVVFKRIMKLLKMHQVGRHYYNPDAATAIKQHKLEVWPGYISAVTPFEGGLMLQADVSHKLLRQETVLQKMYDIYQTSNANFKDACLKELIGSVVLTRYNNRTYRIDDVEWDKNPQSEFIFHSGEPMKYTDYYKKSYDITIEDLKQPLIIHHPKKPRQGAKTNEVVCLIPELCTLTGLTDRMRQDFRVMKDVAVHTRVVPQERYKSMKKFIDSVYSSQEAMNELNSWGLELSKDLLMTEGRLMKTEKIKFGSGTVMASPEADFNRDATKHSVISAVHLQQWMLVFTKRDEAKALDFKNTICKIAPQMGIEIGNPVVLKLPDERTETYLRAIREHKHPEIQMVVVVFPTARDDRYAAFKKLCCIEQPVPSQVINARTISQANKLRSVSQKILLQMNTKMGGELWRLDIPLKSVMVVGIDVYHDSVGGGRSIGAFVASCNKELTRYYSRVCFQLAGQELIDGLKHCFTAALKKFRDSTGELPEKIVVYRDGVGDGQLPVVANYEVQQLSECFPLFGEDYEPKMAVIVVQKRINMRLFSALNSGHDSRLENPAPGTVVDHSITRKDWFDFFLVSQHVRQGTVTPTHYVVVYDKSTLKPDHLQRLTYKLTHLYYNWPGTIRVPAPCQYAHKLAFLTGQSLHKDPSLELSDKLFYL